MKNVFMIATLISSAFAASTAIANGQKCVDLEGTYSNCSYTMDGVDTVVPQNKTIEIIQGRDQGYTTSLTLVTSETGTSVDHFKIGQEVLVTSTEYGEEFKTKYLSKCSGKTVQLTVESSTSPNRPKVYSYTLRNGTLQYVLKQKIYNGSTRTSTFTCDAI